ncbi:hypothetical protein [Gottfriedia acidiceleris]
MKLIKKFQGIGCSLIELKDILEKRTKTKIPVLINR